MITWESILIEKPMRNMKKPTNFNIVNDQGVRSGINGHRIPKAARTINKVTGIMTYFSVITLVVNNKEQKRM